MEGFCKHDMSMYIGLFTLFFGLAMDLTYYYTLIALIREEKVWKCVSIGFVAPLGHFIYRQRSQQLVVLEGQPQSKDYD